jgi:hypothetical protein
MNSLELVVSHPFARRKANGWGTGLLRQGRKRLAEHRFTEWDELGENGIAGAGGAHLLAKMAIKLVR